MNENLYIVPYDFTSVGDSALKYALYVAEHRKASIVLLHIVSKSGQIDSATKKLQEVVQNLGLSGSIPVTVKAVEGNIFEDIPSIAKEYDARLIIMGTHGAIGMQKIFGSFAMRVIANSNIPFLVVQENVTNYKLDNIVVPITISKESLQIISVAITISKTFNSKIHVIAEHSSDQGLFQKIKIRTSLVEKQFEEYGVDGIIEFIPPKRSYSKAIIDYAKNNNCDLIASAHYSDSLFPQFERYTQNLITNSENIPCLIISAKLMTKLYY